MRYEREDRIVTITINRPEIATRSALTACWMRSKTYSRPRPRTTRFPALSCAGTGSVFSSGGDVKGFAKTAAENQAFPNGTRHWYRKGIQRIPLCLDKMEIPIIAAVNGPAVSAGCVDPFIQRVRRVALRRFAHDAPEAAVLAERGCPSVDR